MTANGEDDFPANLPRVIDGLRLARLDWRAEHGSHPKKGVRAPSREALVRILRELGTALFPLRLGPAELTEQNENAWIELTLESVLSQLLAQISLEIRLTDPGISSSDEGRWAGRIITAFADDLPAIRRRVDGDVEAGYAGDPAARSVDEVLFNYPSIIAVIHYRLAHALHNLGAPLVARIVTEIAHADTGIDIHPAAQIGDRFFIDHGTGVVIGETAIIGNNVRLYQGVTLGGAPVDQRTSEANAAGERRHPLLEDDVIVYAGTAIIGPVRVGAGSRIAGNLWIRADIPAGSNVEAPEPVISVR